MADIQSELTGQGVQAMSPRLAVATVWAILHRMPENDQNRLLEIDPQSDDAVTVQSLAEVSLKVKLQRELAIQCSAEDHNELKASCDNQLIALRDSGSPRTSTVWREAVRNRVHVSDEFTKWRLLLSLTPWISCFSLSHSEYAGALRYQLRLKRRLSGSLPCPATLF